MSRFFFLLVFLVLFVSFGSGTLVIESDEKLTSTTGAGHPSWSPDGKKIVYTANQAIWIMNSDGSGQKKLYDGLAWEGDPQFNEDGTKIYFATESKKAYSARYISIHVMDRDGNNGLKLTETTDSRAPSVSPDGTRLAYASRASGNYDIWVMTTDGTDKVRLTDAAVDESSPSWSPDGSTIVYSSMGDILTIGIDAVRPVKLTNDSYNNVEPAYSPDGKIIAYASDLGGDYDLWIMDSTGSSEMQLTSDLSSERAPSWSPDGRKIAYVSDRTGKYNIWVMTIGNEEIEFENSEVPVEAKEREINNAHVENLREYAVNKPGEFIGIVLLVSFGFVFLIVGSFMRKIS
ncbi:TolB family protein [Methanolobus psychrotolerans]|uniref:TolB family protein n=1 Tax=Methanolobus psychrotolerans TaxID=1874706 RepID=UPI0013ED0813|nr:PD40 domain-containing protein [Methanolobus psychrotolerans]